MSEDNPAGERGGGTLISYQTSPEHVLITVQDLTSSYVVKEVIRERQPVKNHHSAGPAFPSSCMPWVLPRRGSTSHLPA
jgi:hypothetical protein